MRNIQTQQCSFGYGGTRQKSIFTFVFVASYHHPQCPATRQLDQGFTWFLLVLESLVFKFQVAMHAFYSASHTNFKNFSPYAASQHFQNFMLMQSPKYIKKCCVVHIMKVRSGSRGIAPLSPNLGPKWR